MAGDWKRAAWLAPLCFVMSSAHAALIDQNLLLPELDPDSFNGGGGWLIMPGYEIGQTFEVGVSGYFDRVDMQFGFFGIQDTQPIDLVLSLYELSADGLPVGDAIASSHFSRPDDVDPENFRYATYSADFSDLSLFFPAGTSLALVAETDSLTSFWGTWTYATDDGTQVIRGDRYAGGSGIYNGPFTGNEWASFDDDPFLVFDLGMATYMRPVPLPATGLMLLFGLSAFGLLRNDDS
jgi:hypothetical protein